MSLSTNQINLPITALICLLISMPSLGNCLCKIENPSSITLDGSAVVCIHIYKDGSYYKTYPFRTSIDHFEALTITGLASIIQSSTTFSMYVQFQNTEDTTIQQILVSNSTAEIYREIMSVVIGITNGGFDKITIDNASCDVCEGGQTCVNGECFTQGATYGDLDPRMFISWVGTDSGGDHCISHTRRLSRFTQFSVNSAYNSAKNIISA